MSGHRVPPRLSLLLALLAGVLTSSDTAADTAAVLPPAQPPPALHLYNRTHRPTLAPYYGLTGLEEPRRHKRSSSSPTTCCTPVPWT